MTFSPGSSEAELHRAGQRDVRLPGHGHRLVRRVGGGVGALAAANVNPTATFTAPASVNEGATFTISLTGLHDVPADQPTLTSSLDCGAATTVSPGVCKAGGTGTVTVKGTVTDKDGGSTTYTQAVHVLNVPPTANAGGPYSGAAGAPIAVHGTATDPGLPDDTLTFAWDCDSNGTTDATGANATCTYFFDPARTRPRSR